MNQIFTHETHSNSAKFIAIFFGVIHVLAKVKCSFKRRVMFVTILTADC